MAHSESLQESYDAHPLNGAALKLRLTHQGRDKPTQVDLALDSETSITDQNHIGGLSTVIQLAEVLRLTSRSRVCDIGGGLGGPARSLAYLFGCTVHVVDVHERRCRDAKELTQLVGLQSLVTVECANAEANRSTGPFDVIWGQSAWVQFERLSDVLQLWRDALSSGGRAACEDVFLRRRPVGSEVSAATELEHIWNCQLSPYSHWQNEFRVGGFHIEVFHDLSFLLEGHFARLSTSGQVPGAQERRGWMIAGSLARAGVLGYGRWIAV